MKYAILTAAAVLLAACGDSTGLDSSVKTLQKTDVVVGTGATAQAGKTVTVHYTGWLYSETAPDHHGTQFDSSYSKDPIYFPLGIGYVIAGWDLGIAGMKVGGKRTLIIPSSMAYGRTGYGAIPPNTPLVFDVELLKVE